MERIKILCLKRFLSCLRKWSWNAARETSPIFSLERTPAPLSFFIGRKRAISNSIYKRGKWKVFQSLDWSSDRIPSTEFNMNFLKFVLIMILSVSLCEAAFGGKTAGHNDKHGKCLAKLCKKCVHIKQYAGNTQAARVCNRYLMNPCCRNALQRNGRLFWKYLLTILLL